MAQTKQAKEKTMRAVAIDKFGGPETLKMQTVPVPEIEPDEILIRVEAAGVGAWDPYEREGGFVQFMDGKPKFPYVLGTDGGGTIAEVGDEVKNFKKGDRVYALSLANPKGGCYAEYASVKAANASPIPGDITFEQAAVMPVDALTGLKGLDNVLGVKKGETVMIYGASGGIGHLAVQLAKALGARVFAVASGKDGVEFVKELGADAAVDGKSEGVLKAAKKFAPDGIDAALVTAGGEGADRALSAVRVGGRVAHPTGVMLADEPPHEMKVKVYDGDNNGGLMKKL